MRKRTLLYTCLRVVAIFTFAYILVCCKDEKDTSFPEIIYSSPQFMQEFKVGDTIVVQALISDENVITSVKVNLANDQFGTASPVKTFSPNSQDFALDTRIHIDDGSLESGSYYVLIRAENGVNFKNKYQDIFIRGTDREFVQLVVITGGAFNDFSVLGTSNFEIPGPLFTVSGDFAAAAISPADHLLFIAGRNTPNIHAYNLENNTLAWLKEATPGKPMHNDDCLYFDGLLYATYNFSFIHGYSASGQLGFNVFTGDFDGPGRICKHQEFVLVEMQKKNALNPYIATYFASTGNEKQIRFITFDVVNFHSLDNNLVVVVSNQDGHGVIHTYDVMDDVLTFMQDVDQPLHGSVMMEDGMIALAGENLTWAYDPVVNQRVKMLDTGALTICYEHLSDLLILGSALEINVYKYPEMVNQKTLLLSDTILDLIIQYSK